MSAPPLLMLTAADVARAAPPLAQVVDLVEDTYRREGLGEVDIPAKVGVHPHGDKRFMHAMPAAIRGTGAVGVKWVSYYADNTALGIPASTALIVLNDADTGLPIAMLDGMGITYARTAAGAALAVRRLANPSPRTLGLVGCGPIGEWTLRAVSAVAPSITEVFVASARGATREAFCARMAGEGGWRLTPVAHNRDAVQGLDIVVSSTPKLDVPAVQGEWFSPGTLMVPLDVAGAWAESVYAAADRIVVDHVGNLRAAIERFRPRVVWRDDVTTTLPAVLTGRAAGRRSADERVIAFVTGVGSLDIALAQVVVRRARELGLGTRFAFN